MNPEELPSGWSLDRNKYFESYDRESNTPFADYAIAIPFIKENPNFSEFWSKICKNAGAQVTTVKDAGTTLFLYHKKRN